jgi:uncharacterized membrane protein
MNRNHWLLLLAPVLAACETTRTVPHDPVEMVDYAAIGEAPFWMVAIGDDAIVLTLGQDPQTGTGGLLTHHFPRTLPRTVDGTRRWESAEGTQVITVEARPGPCDGSGGRRYEDRVTARLSGRELNGCGGRLLADDRE